MKLDNYELTIQRVKLLQDMVELQEHLEVLKENTEYIFSLLKMPGVFFRIKDLVYILLTENCNIGVDACILTSFVGRPTVVFRVLDNHTNIEYYKTEAGKIEALNKFGQYIVNNSSTVLHELVHVDDQRNGIAKADDKSISVDPYKYYNHPSEIRAYTQQHLYLMQSEIGEAINSGKVITKEDLKNFCKIYKDYKNIFTKAKEKNNFVYWTSETFNDYLENLNFIIEAMSLKLPD